MAFKLAQTPLKDRIEALRAEINAYIDELAAKDKAESPNQPIQVLRNILTARGGQCECRNYLIHSGELK